MWSCGEGEVWVRRIRMFWGGEEKDERRIGRMVEERRGIEVIGGGEEEVGRGL